MTKLPYLRSMFATCMLFQVIYVLCVILWLAFPTLRGHEMLLAIFPNFKLLTIGSFIYGLVASMIYGWIAAIIFVFFYNLWPNLVALVLGRQGNKARTAGVAAILLAVALAALPAWSPTAYAQGAQNTSASLPQSTVQALQDALNKQGIAVKADGVFTQETREAVRKFQSQHHLPVTGEADRATLAKLGVAASASTAQATPGQSTAGGQSPGMGMGMAQGGMMGGSMMNGPMMHGMMQGMMKTMQGMMGMMQAQPDQPASPPMQQGESRQTQGQGGMMANCPMMSGESAPAMMQMMQGMMQMMQTMQGQMQSAPKQ